MFTVGILVTDKLLVVFVKLLLEYCAFLP